MYRRYSRTRKGCVIINNDSQPILDDLLVNVSYVTKELNPQFYITGDFFETGFIGACPSSINGGELMKSLFSLNKWGLITDKIVLSVLFIGYNNSAKMITGECLHTIHLKGETIYLNCNNYYDNALNLINNEFSESSTHLLAIPIRSEIYYGFGVNTTLPIINMVASASYKDLYKSENKKYICPYNTNYEFNYDFGYFDNHIRGDTVRFLNKVHLGVEEEMDNMLLTRNNNSFYEYVSLPNIDDLIGDSIITDTFELTTLNF